MTREQFNRWMDQLDKIANEMGSAYHADPNEKLKLAIAMIDSALDRLDEAAAEGVLQ